MGNKIRMIGIDFDGTLVEHTKDGPYVPPETRVLLEDLITRGVYVGIVSGNQWWDMRGNLEKAGIPWGDPFPTFVLSRETFLHWQKNGSMISDKEWNVARGGEMGELVRFLSAKQYDLFVDLEAAGFKVMGFPLLGDYGLEVHFSTEEEAERARLWLAEWAKDIPFARTHRNVRNANIVLATAGKGKSLLRAATVRGLEPQQVLAIGDSYNDLDMLDGHLGIWPGAVGNAAERVKDAVRQAGGVVATKVAGAGVEEILLSDAWKSLMSRATP